MSRIRKVAVAILTWNGRRHLETCLPALCAQRDPGVAWETVVLDNGSHDGTVAWLRAAHPEVRVIESGANLGFCAGNDRLVEAIDADAVALLNNDTRPKPDWLAALVAALAGAPDDVAAVSGQIVDWEGARLDFGEGVMTFDGHAFQRDFRRPLRSAHVPRDGEELLFACGGNLLVRRDVFRAVGGFDPTFFAYLEDVDLGWRLWSAGHRVTFARDAVVHHRSAATSDLLGVFNRGFLFERNAFLTAYRNFEAGIWERMMPAVLLTLLARTRAMLVENNPGAATLEIDPYAGAIANTAAALAGAPVAAPPPAPAPAPVADGNGEGFAAKWRRFGTRELLRRGVARALRTALARVGPDLGGTAAVLATVTPAAVPIAAPVLTDERTIAQLRALSWILRNLDGVAAERAEVQRRRVRSDREIFERFPLWVVPTYPGDYALFGREGFAAWLPRDVPLRRGTLQDLMEL